MEARSRFWCWEIIDKNTGEILQSSDRCVGSLAALCSAVRFIVKVRLEELFNDTYHISIYDEPPDLSTRVPVNQYEFKRV